MKRYLLLLLIPILLINGCSVKKTDTDGRTDMDFTVVAKDDIPKELLTVIEEKKNEEFTMSYGDGEFLYIVEGYGKMPTGGYSIRVDEMYETTDEIVIHTTLMGPKAGEAVNKMETYPYIAVKIEYTDKNIVFE